ncbi:MAG TPA: PAS domain S-box protein, partial [Planctomycetota bacterium]|nr:PAS domain S-box protein [Planctomycetota bacterium]
MAHASEPRPVSTLAAPDQGLLRLLGGNVSAILWTTDPTLTITSLAGGGLATLGRQPGTQRGQTLFEYLGTQDRQSPPIAAHLRALEGQPGDYAVEYRGRNFFSHVEPLRGEDGQVVGVVGLGLDMTETLRTQRDLKDSEERFRSIFDKSPLGIGIAYKGTLRYVNQALLGIFRYDDPSDLLGKSVLDHIAPRCRDDIRLRIASRERGQPISDSFDTIGIRKDGSEFTYHLDVARIRLPEGDGSVAFVTDITDRVQAQDELRKAHEELEKRVEQRTAELAQANRQLQAEVE